MLLAGSASSSKGGKALEKDSEKDKPVVSSRTSSSDAISVGAIGSGGVMEKKTTSSIVNIASGDEDDESGEEAQLNWQKNVNNATDWAARPLIQRSWSRASLFKAYSE